MSASTKPIIAVAWPKADYVASIEQAGAVTRRLDPSADPLPGALDACDGVLLTGGPDVDPLIYGETERHATVEVAPDRDAYEIALARAALARDLPILAICRGAQVLNVAAGGSLIQDIPSQAETALDHADASSPDKLAHAVTIAPGTCLALLMADQMGGHTDIGVNSRHHQSVKTPAPGFIVSATAPDGVVEAIERPDSHFCLGVQWHPENFWRSGRFSSLFKGLVDAARSHRRDRTYPGSSR